MQGKPGINLLRVSKVYTLDSQTFNTLKEVVNRLQPLGILGRNEPIPDDVTEFELLMGQSLRGVLKTRFVLGDSLEVASIDYKRDVEGNLQVIDDAKRQADWVFVACHHHLTDGLDGQIPSKAVRDFAHACIDSGADGWFGSGPHQIQGIEIYNDKPIFYSLGNFIFDSYLEATGWSVILSITMSEKKVSKWEAIPVLKSEDHRLALARGERKDELQKEVLRRCNLSRQEIVDTKKYEKEYISELRSLEAKSRHRLWWYIAKRFACCRAIYWPQFLFRPIQRRTGSW